MINGKLRTSNKLLKELNETYYVYKCFSVDNVYNVMHEDTRMHYFHVKIDVKRKSVVKFNGVEFEDTNSLLNAVEEYNKTLFFPSWFFDVDGKPSYMEENKIEWYLTDKLGFERHRGRSGLSHRGLYVLKDDFDRELSSISFRMDKDSLSGTIYKYFGERFTDIHFDNAEEAVNIINSFVIFEGGLYIRKVFKTIGKICGEYGSLKGAKLRSMDDFIKGFEGEDLKEKMIASFEKALEALRKS